MTDIHVRVNGLNVVHTFVVVNMQNQCIFGADFLKANGMVVNIAQELLSWDSGEMRLLIEAAAPTINKLSVLLEKYADVFVNGPHRRTGRGGQGVQLPPQKDYKVEKSGKCST
jgi:hypothetical protein